MRITSLLHENDLTNEERKRSINQRKVNDVYKKNASYVQADQNPVVEMLNNLLSGKTEKEVHEKQSHSLEIPKKVDSELSTAVPVGSNSEFEQDKKIYFSPTIPFQQRTTKIVDEKEQFNGEGVNLLNDEKFDIFIPERLTNDFSRTVNEETVFGKNLEHLLLQRTFNKAKSSYSYQMEMARIGFVVPESKFSLTA